jgi:hypothetical protein
MSGFRTACDWLLDPEPGRRSNGNLNKGESRHALARAVFFHRLGELRDRTAEDMAHRASGLNLAVNAIALWNTTYLARAVAYVRGQGVALTDEELSHVAPVRWDHIALTGDYLWSDVHRQITSPFPHLAGMASRGSSLALASPPSAAPTLPCASASRRVRRAWGATSSGRRSAKVLRGQAASRQ